jgi:hypothetical protein
MSSSKLPRREAVSSAQNEVLDVCAAEHILKRSAVSRRDHDGRKAFTIDRCRNLDRDPLCTPRLERVEQHPYASGLTGAHCASLENGSARVTNRVLSDS